MTKTKTFRGENDDENEDGYEIFSKTETKKQINDITNKETYNIKQWQ